MRKLKDRIRIKISREQMLCIIAAIVLAILSYISNIQNESGFKGEVERNGYGGTPKEYTVLVEGLSDSKEEVSFSIGPVAYTEEEAEAEFEGIMEEIAFHILADNKDLNHITEDLNFKKSIPGHEGVKLSFSPEDTQLISYDGIVNNQRLEEDTKTSIKVKLKTGDFSEEYILPVTVQPKPLENREKLIEKLKQSIEQRDRENENKKEFLLPDRIGDIRITYSKKKDKTPLMVLLLGAVAAVALSLKPENDKKKAKKERETELLVDYSELVSKLIVYIGAGLTIRNAWIKISESNREDAAHFCGKKRALYEEVERTERELINGVSERKAYMDFAKRCGLKCYIRLASLLEQNRKNGDSGLIAALSLEMEEAFEQRKNTAKRLGEEAGTKLIFPLIISLMTVIMIVAVPALLGMQ